MKYTYYYYLGVLIATGTDLACLCPPQDTFSEKRGKLLNSNSNESAMHTYQQSIIFLFLKHCMFCLKSGSKCFHSVLSHS